MRSNISKYTVAKQTTLHTKCRAYINLCISINSTILLRMRHVSDKSCRENQNTSFIKNTFFSIIMPVASPALLYFTLYLIYEIKCKI